MNTSYVEAEIENRSYAAASPPLEALVPASTRAEALVHHQGAYGDRQNAQQPQLQQTAYCGWSVSLVQDSISMKQAVTRIAELHRQADSYHGERRTSLTWCRSLWNQACVLQKVISQPSLESEPSIAKVRLPRPKGPQAKVLMLSVKHATKSTLKKLFNHGL